MKPPPLDSIRRAEGWPDDASPAGLRAAEARGARAACRHLWAAAGWAVAAALAVVVVAGWL